MKIKLLVGQSGFWKSHAAGDVVDFEQRRAERLILAGQAVPVIDGQPLETAMISRKA